MTRDEVISTDPLSLTEEQLLEFGVDAAKNAMSAAYSAAYNCDPARQFTEHVKSVMSGRFHRYQLAADNCPPDRNAARHRAICTAAQVRVLLQLRQIYAEIVAAAQSAADQASRWVPLRQSDARPGINPAWPQVPPEFTPPQASILEALPPRFDLAKWLEDRPDAAYRLMVVADTGDRPRLRARGFDAGELKVLADYEAAVMAWLDGRKQVLNWVAVRPTTMDAMG
jgi:hypothetical protein